MCGRKYDVIPQNGDCSRESNVRTLVFRNKSVIKRQRRYRTQYGKYPPSDNTIRRWLKQFQETGCVLHRKGAGRPSTSQEVLIESRKLGHLTCQERCSCWSCLAFCCSIHFISKKTFRVTLSYSVSSFTISGLKIIGHENRDSNLESSCTSTLNVEATSNPQLRLNFEALHSAMARR
jgi:hypothetical protein